MRELPRPVLAERTTIRLGGTALAEIVLESEEDSALLPGALRRLGGEPFVLGAGSNLLARDGDDLPLILVRPALEDGPEIVGETEGRILVRAGAGVPMPRLLRFCAESGLGGLEGLAGVPGSVGGAIAMNAGSFGTETCAALHAIRIWTEDGGIRDLPAGELEYGYRHMRPRDGDGRIVILAGTFALTGRARDVIKGNLRHNFFEKKSRQPVTARSAGCVFRNPPGGESAGRLLDAAGFRGRRRGDMAFSDMHANFLVNLGRGRADDALALLDLAREAVARRFGVDLELEVRIIP